MKSINAKTRGVVKKIDKRGVYLDPSIIRLNMLLRFKTMRGAERPIESGLAGTR
jgi:hypothetical protein